MLIKTGVGEFGSESWAAINEGRAVNNTVANQKNFTGPLRSENIPDLPAYLEQIVERELLPVSTVWKETAENLVKRTYYNKIRNVGKASVLISPPTFADRG